MAENRFKCEGCGKQFDNRGDMQKHEQQCPAMQSRKGQSSGGSKTRTAGSQPPES